MSDWNTGIAHLLESYRAGTLRPSEAVRSVYERIAERGERPVWISVVPEEQALARAGELERDTHALSLPLYGIPFAVKDNIDVAGMKTTAGCPAFAYVADRSATVVDKLLAAGAVLIGKTNMDQFATGLVGVRSPYGGCSSVFDSAYISGGSSSGSAVAVASSLVSFSLGTDTAGSGRVPASCNGTVGWKPTRGFLSTSGVVPACRSLDCVSVFARTCEDAELVCGVAAGVDESDPYSRPTPTGEDAAPWVDGSSFRFGVPEAAELEFFGDEDARRLFDSATAKLQQLGGELVRISFEPFRQAAALLYSGPWVAERLAAIETFMSLHGDDMHPVVRQIIEGGSKYSAVDAFRAMYELERLKQRAGEQLESIDVLVLPTAGTTFTIEEVEEEPVKRNTDLGYYTNFVNLLDLAAVAIPAGFRSNGLPFGISIIAPAFRDRGLLTLGSRFEGADRHDVQSPGCVRVAVVGAHLTGQPLNRELTSRGARLVETTRTMPGYRLYALAGTAPPKPGLVRDEAGQGDGIEVEVWSMPENEFGSFVAAIPPPLGIGTVTLANRSAVKCFICEPYAIAGSLEITHYGGWRNYLDAGGGTR